MAKELFTLDPQDAAAVVTSATLRLGAIRTDEQFQKAIAGAILDLWEVRRYLQEGFEIETSGTRVRVPPWRADELLEVEFTDA